MISPLVGVESERFAVWMKIAALPTFKLYRRINSDLKKGDILFLDIAARRRRAGQEAIVVATAASFENRGPSGPS